MAAAILEKVRALGSVTFADLDRDIDGFGGGNASIELGQTNIVLWSGMSDAGLAALLEVRPLLEPHPCSALVYLFDGAALKLPIAKGPGPYAHKRWLPTSFTLKAEHLPAETKEGK